MKIALVQMNPTVGDVVNNGKKIINYCQQAQALGAHLVIFPELCLIGYPPKDLVLRDDFLKSQELVLDQIAKSTFIDVLLGAAIRPANIHRSYNGAVLCSHGSWRMVAKKILLPNYNVFDEKRHFSEPLEQACAIITVRDKRLLITICEDAWATIPNLSEIPYHFDPIKNALSDREVDLIVNISASPFSTTKPKNREKIFAHLAKTNKTPLVAVGQVGANDQLMFDGHSLVIDHTGKIIQRANACREDILLYDPEAEAKPVRESLKDDDLLIEVIAMGIKDYVEKCGAKGVIVGVSGGIDSALCAALSVRALGSDRVTAIFLPSRFNSIQSLRDVQLLASNLSINLKTMPIEDVLNNLRGAIWHPDLCLNQKNEDIIDQNLQSRLRGLLIMAISNAGDHFMVATSNKSELSVGYTTIYGDLCGAFSPLGDVYKTKVYRLAQVLNDEAGFDIIPHSIIRRPPTAELRPDQLDTDSLPDYAVLDKILFNFIDLEKSVAEIESITQVRRSLILKVLDMVSKSEYKRRQCPPPFMVSDKVFGDARRLPIAKRIDFALSDEALPSH